MSSRAESPCADNVAPVPAFCDGDDGPVSSRRLRIGIDGEALRVPFTGVGHYVFNLCVELERLLPHAVFFVYARRGLPAIHLPSSRWQLRAEPSHAWAHLPSVPWLKLRSPRLCAQDSLDLYWGGRTFLPRLPGGVRTLSTVHDLNASLAARSMDWKHRLVHQAWFADDARRADRVVCNSKGTADRLQQRLEIATAAVVPPGARAHFLAAAKTGREAVPLPDDLVARGVRPPYLLSVATHEPRKNLVLLLDAFEALQAAGELPRHLLVLVGASGWKNAALEARIRRAPATVVRTGYVADAALPALYAHADALVFPSSYEGFGMPVLEARICGTRVVATDIAELREAGGPSAIYIQPTAAGIAGGIRRALASPPPAGDAVELQRWTWGASGRVMATQMVDAAAAPPRAPRRMIGR